MISKASLASQIARLAQNGRPGGQNAVPMPDLGAFSPVVSSYHEWMSGFGVGKPLPRPVLDFLSGAFGPLAPITPFAIDRPDEESGRPGPRRWQYPVGLNLPQYPGNLKLISFANLRAYADLYSVARTCVQLRKQEILGLEWDIVPTSEAHEAMRGDKAALAEFQERRNIALGFWRRPDPNYNNISSWLSACLEDLFVIDALSLYLHPTRLPGSGPFGSDLAALEVLDGSTIYPLVDVAGASPRPPAPAYQQYIWGVPRVDLMTIMLEEDQERIKEELGEPVRQYRGDQLLYAPYVTRSFTPYGFPPMEQAILPITIGLRRQQWALDFFSEGSIPGMFVIAPPEWTPQQIRTFQDSLNALGGDVAMKWRVIVLPGGSKPELQKPPEVASAADQFIVESVLMAFDVKPMELGVAPSGQHGLGGRGLAEASQKAAQRHSLVPLLRWLESAVFDYVIQNVWGQRDMRFRFIGAEETEDEGTKAETMRTYVSAGILTLDEARLAIDQEPYGLPETSSPQVLTASGYVPVTAPAQPQTTAPDGGTGQEPPGVEPGESPEQPSRGESEGNQPAAAPEPAEESETHAAGKAASTYDELEQLKQYLRHGRDPNRFRSVVIPASLVKVISARYLAGDRAAFSWARALLKMRDAKDEAINKIMDDLAHKLGGLAGRLVKGDIVDMHFVDSAVAELQAAYQKALEGGGKAEYEGYELTAEDINIALQYAVQQRQYLAGLAEDVMGMATSEAGEPMLDEGQAASLRNRLGLYASTAYARWEEGRLHGYKARTGDTSPRITWHTVGDSNVCELCAERDGRVYKEEDLPGFPGDGGFGDLCEGAVNCRCFLSWSPGEEMEPVEEEACD